MDNSERMSEGDPAEASMSDGEEGFFAEDLTDEEDDDLDDEDDSDDVLADMVDRSMGGVGMDGSDSDIDYGREGFFYPFDNDLILTSLHRERYGCGHSYNLSVPRSGLKNGWTHIFSAALSGSTDIVEREMRHKAGYGESGALEPQNRDFPVHCSANAMAELRKNIAHHLCDCQMRTLLMYAVSSGSIETVRAVLSTQSSEETQAQHRLTVSGFLRRCDVLNRTVFHYAAHGGYLNILKYLLDQLDDASKWPEFTMEKQNGSSLEPLPENSLQPNVTRISVLRHESNDVGPTLLCQAALGGHLEMVKLLLSLGAYDRFSQPPPSDPGSSEAPQPRQQDTALICAATNGHVNIVKAIIASGTYDLAARGQFGEAAVHRAAACKHKDVLQLLLEHGADADAIAQPPEGWTDSERNRLTHYWGGTALLRAAHVGDLERVDMLLAKNAKVDVADCDADTALHAATSTLHIPVIKRLTEVLKNDELAKLLARTNIRGNTALHSAFDKLVAGEVGVISRVTEVVKHLVALHKEHKISLDIQDAEGATPLYLAAKYDVSEGVRTLIAAGADLNLATTWGYTALTAAASGTSIQIVKDLLAAGADPHATVERSKETALHIVVLGGLPEEQCIDVCEHLMNAGADVNALDMDEKSPIIRAAENHRQKLLHLFLCRGGTLDWMSEAGEEAFHALYGSQDANLRAHEMREFQQSVESCSKAVRLCSGRDLGFVGGLINRALTEGFIRIASAVLEQHMGRLDAAGNNLLMLATMQKLTLLVKEMVYMGGVNVELRNHAGDTAMVIACREGNWESFLDLYGAGAESPNSPNAELMIAASLHQWMRVKEILQRLVDEKNGAHHCVRAGTPIPRNHDTSHNACLDTPHHTMHVSPAVHAASGSSSHPSHAATDAADDPCPAVKRRRDADGNATVCASTSSAACTATSPRASNHGDFGRDKSGSGSGSDDPSHGKLGWLITLLMGAREPGAYDRDRAGGQPCVSMRDRILTLLRPMMNFHEKVAFFQEEQDKLLDYEIGQGELEGITAEDTLNIQVHRGPEILLDTVREIQDVEPVLLRRELTVEFLGEDGEDGGGLLREFCHELADVIRDPGCALFQQVPDESGLYQPSEKAHVQADAVDVVSVFRSLGIVVAKAIISRACFPLRFTQSFLKQMLDEKLDLEDLRSVDEEHHNGLTNILKNPLQQLGMDGLTFTTETSFFGQISTVDLIPNGSQTMVTDENKHEYVQLLARHKMTESIKPYINAFCNGLWACIPLHSLRIFSPEQLGLLIAGRQHISAKEMMSCTKYEGFSGEEECIKWFWDIVKEMDQKSIAKLLAFITGTSVVPAIGFKGFRSPLTITRASQGRLPSAHTCANQLVLSEYSDKELLKKHLFEILEQHMGFQFV